MSDSRQTPFRWCPQNVRAKSTFATCVDVVVQSMVRPPPWSIPCPFLSPKLQARPGTPFSLVVSFHPANPPRHNGAPSLTVPANRPSRLFLLPVRTGLNFSLVLILVLSITFDQVQTHLLRFRWRSCPVPPLLISYFWGNLFEDFFSNFVYRFRPGTVVRFKRRRCYGPLGFLSVLRPVDGYFFLRGGESPIGFPLRPW